MPSDILWRIAHAAAGRKRGERGPVFGAHQEKRGKAGWVWTSGVPQLRPTRTRCFERSGASRWSRWRSSWSGLRLQRRVFPVPGTVSQLQFLLRKGVQGVPACTAPRLVIDRSRGVRGPTLSSPTHQRPTVRPGADRRETPPASTYLPAPKRNETRPQRARQPAIRYDPKSAFWIVTRDHRSGEHRHHRLPSFLSLAHSQAPSASPASTGSTCARETLGP